MNDHSAIVLILGSGPNAPEAQDLPDQTFDAIVAVNNAWRVRHDWTHLIFPEDFPNDRHPPSRGPQQTYVTASDFVPAQNRFGGFVYAGGTMAFTAGYWALDHLRPRVMAFLGCDMVYPKAGQTHFYGTGTADPLRPDITLQSLPAKAARLALMAADRGCHCVNLSRDPSRLVFPRAKARDLQALATRPPVTPDFSQAARREDTLGYVCPSGRYWETPDAFDATALRGLDALWLCSYRAAERSLVRA